MIGSLITMFLFIGVFALSFGMLLAHIMWTPPGQ